MITLDSVSEPKVISGFLNCGRGKQESIEAGQYKKTWLAVAGFEDGGRGHEL
jgi:hypothetical protein